MVKSVLFTKQKEKSKEKDKEKDNELLSKKRAEPDTPKKDVDMVKIKKKINEIMYSICTPNNNSQNDNIDYIYQSMHKNYLLNEFTSNCLNYINKIILDVNKNHLKKFQGLFELNKLFISIIKELLMNEFELLLLSLYLESIDLSSNSDIFPLKESLIYLCYFIKKLTLSSEKLSPINSFLIRKYQGFEDKFNKWFQSNSSIFNSKLYFSYIEINQRFIEYNISYSIYCKNNYIDYNLIIDRILTMSIPYNECKNDNLFVDKKNNTNDFLLDNNSNLNTNSFQNLNDNKNNINEILFSSNNSLNKNNFNNNKINGLYTPNYIPTFNPSIFINPKNNTDINLGYLYNGNNIIFNNSKNNNNDKINNKEFIPIKQNETKNIPNFKINNINNINKNVNKNNLNITKNNQLNEDNQISSISNNKPLFITEEKKQKEENKIEEEEKKDNSNNINNNNVIKNEKDLEKPKKKEISITPNNLLYSIGDENNNIINNINQNNHIDNLNLFDKMFRQKKNDKNNLNCINNLNNINNINNTNNLNNINNLHYNLIKNNEGINSNPNQNNILGFNPSQQIQDLNPLKYNNNLGINDFNPSSQMSFISSKNPIFLDLNNLYHNSFHGIEQDENMKQLYQSNDNFFRSLCSFNSSKNFFPVINNVNIGNNGNNNIGDSGNINNFNYPPINQMMTANTAFFNINNGLNNNLNYGKNIVIQEKKVEDNKNNKKNDEK